MITRGGSPKAADGFAVGQAAYLKPTNKRLGSTGPGLHPGPVGFAFPDPMDRVGTGSLRVTFGLFATEFPGSYLGWRYWYFTSVESGRRAVCGGSC